jgi:hypothetical protein
MQLLTDIEETWGASVARVSAGRSAFFSAAEPGRGSHLGAQH